MDYNATTPLEPEVIQAVSEALGDAWGNPSSSYLAGRILMSKRSVFTCIIITPFMYLIKITCFLGAKAKAIINQSRQNVAKMVGGKAEDIVFTSGGTEVTAALIFERLEHSACVQNSGFGAARFTSD